MAGIKTTSTRPYDVLKLGIFGGSCLYFYCQTYVPRGAKDSEMAGFKASFDCWAPVQSGKHCIKLKIPSLKLICNP